MRLPLIRNAQAGAGPLETTPTGVSPAAGIQAHQIRNAGVGLFPGVSGVQKPGDLGGVKAALQAELAALESEARGLRTESKKLQGEIGAVKAELERLTKAEHDLHGARDKARDEVKSAKKVRRAEYDEAKALIDEQFVALRRMGASETTLAAARKRMLGRLAREGIRAGTPGQYGGKATTDWVRTELSKLAAGVSADAGPKADKGKIDRTLAALESGLLQAQSDIAGKQSVVSSHRQVAVAVETKAKSVAEKIEDRKSRIEARQARLDEIEPRLKELDARIKQVQEAIHAIEAASQLIRTQDQIAEKRHEQTMTQAADAKRQASLRELKQRAEKIEASLFEMRRAEAKSDTDRAREQQIPQARADHLRQQVANVRSAVQLAGDGEVRGALAVIERLLDSIAAAESPASQQLPKNVRTHR